MMDLHNVFILLALSFSSVFTVLHGQKVVTDLKVTGYQGYDVTLFCQYIHGDTEEKIQEVRWTWQNQSSKYSIMVFHIEYGLSIQETPLKDRVSFSKSSPPINEASIIIKDVKMSDQGVFSCDYTIFPSGSQTGQTTLTVLEGTPALSTAKTVGIVTAVVVITLIIAVVWYFRRCNRRRADNSFTYSQSLSDLQQGVTNSDVTMKPGKANRRTSSSWDTEYTVVVFSVWSGSVSLRASSNQMALGFHTVEQDTVHAQVKKD